MNQVAFEARLGGVGACFCFIVSTSTYIFLFGRERYEEELRYIKEAHTGLCEINKTEEKFVEPTEFAVFPSQILNYKPNTQYIVSFQIFEKEQLNKIKE